MDLEWLEDALALARQHSFSRAAEARNVTQPAFSRRIRALEDWLGTPLFIRGPQGVSLTPAGEHFCARAGSITRDLSVLRREVRTIAGREATSLSFAATHVLSFTFFPRWLREHVGLPTSGAVNLISDSMQGCEQAALSGDVHFLLCHHHEASPSRFDAEEFPSLVVGQDRLVPLSAPDENARPLWSLPGSAERPARLLSYNPSSGLGRILAASLPAGGDRAFLETSFTSHLAATLMTMAREGEGIAWLPRSIAEDDIAAGHLVPAGAPDSEVPVDIRLFRAIGCRSTAADELWKRLGG